MRLLLLNDFGAACKATRVTDQLDHFTKSLISTLITMQLAQDSGLTSVDLDHLAYVYWSEGGLFTAKRRVLLMSWERDDIS